MSTSVQEGKIRMRIPDGATARKFDDMDNHDYTNVMKCVDFIVDAPDRLLFIEIKDPDNPKISPKNKEKFVNEFQTGQLDESLKYKYRDSFIHEWATDKVRKPVYYYVLIALGNMTKAELLTKSDRLRSKIPMLGKKFIAGCEIFNIATWNQHLGDYRVTRI